MTESDAGTGSVPAGARDGEYAFIGRMRQLFPRAPVGQVWIGDDAAVLSDGLLLKTDVLVEGVHFELDWCSPGDVGWKALAVNLSDIAAMGGTPVAAVVSLVVRSGVAGLADGVMAGLADAGAHLGCPIVGGDTSSGPVLMVAVSVLGRVERPGPVLRSGARPGDVIFVTGSLGGAGAALNARRSGVVDPPGLARLRRPTPRLSEGPAAAAAGATAMIDLSDGLVVDLGRVCLDSGCSAVLYEEDLPLFAGAEIETALFGGDDYELLFTVPADRLGQVGSWSLTPITAVGLVTEGAPEGAPPVLLRGAAGIRPLRGPVFEHRIAGPVACDLP